MLNIKMLSGLLVWCLVCSCGTSDESKPVVASVDTEAKGSRNQSWMLAEFADLPECVDEIMNQLAYVKAENKFYYCDKDRGWETVVIDGKDGSNGIDGVVGETGENGSDGVMTSPNVWVDEFDGTEWLVGGPVDGADVECPAGYSIPDVLTLEPAYEHGLGTALLAWGVDPFVWVQNVNAPYLVEAYKDLRTFTTVVSNTGGSLFCLKD
jgi:hypothetical protein